jgi:hypothetical protein
VGTLKHGNIEILYASGILEIYLFSTKFNSFKKINT